ncbi:hypothetical protein EV210_10447 [Anaerospora hongkongensis]|uniref:Uncharacterized protein n=1 Tax=Anaerospora hongkongensis TaxID=244830 RepID=A0A4R1PYY9_9FIRM|nr:hypothetical protein [Anaerospora hongkongensis]TCL38081.1 hypothetical protein EV210_10447 [Anaerospora hongkongensis]
MTKVAAVRADLVDNYLEHVQQIAKSIGKIFMLDTGEGNDLEDEASGWYIEDLSGWLIEPSEIIHFIAARESDMHYKNFADSYVLAKWCKTASGTIDIDFKYYKNI